jgi:hypothetical protein
MIGPLQIAAAVASGIGAKKQYDIAKQQLKLQQEEAKDRARTAGLGVHEASQRGNLAGFADAFGQRYDTGRANLGKIGINRQRQIIADANRQRGAAAQARAGAGPAIAQYIADQRSRLGSSMQGPGGAYSQYSAGVDMPSEFMQAAMQRAGTQQADLGQRADLMSQTGGAGTAMDMATKRMSDAFDVTAAGEGAMLGASEDDVSIAGSMLDDQNIAAQGLINRRKNMLDRMYGGIGPAVRQGVNTSNPWKSIGNVLTSLSNIS